MNKPTPKKREPIMDYHEMINFIEKKYNIEVRDYANKHGLDKEYQIKTGINVYDCPISPGGKCISMASTGHRQITKEEYDEEMKQYYAICKQYDEWKKQQSPRPYLDYWHWLLDHSFDEVQNPCTQYWGIKEILDDEDTPEWVKEITQKIYDEFKENLDEDGGLVVEISW